jgi:hypothetical protein
MTARPSHFTLTRPKTSPITSHEKHPQLRLVSARSLPPSRPDDVVFCTVSESRRLRTPAHSVLAGSRRHCRHADSIRIFTQRESDPIIKTPIAQRRSSAPPFHSPRPRKVSPLATQKTKLAQLRLVFSREVSARADILFCTVLSLVRAPNTASHPSFLPFRRDVYLNRDFGWRKPAHFLRQNKRGGISQSTQPINMCVSTI